ncbi:MAG: potassium channel family protein [Oscillospiraceae bacterium]
MKTFVVIGLGRFGTAVAVELCKLGHEVLAIDINENIIQAIADKVTHAAAGDAADPAVLKALGVRNYDCAIVAAAQDVGESALITLSLKELGVPKVVCKAKDATHKRVLERIGADRVIIPEQETGVKLAQGLARSNVLNFIELSEDYGIVEVDPPEAWCGKTLLELNVRARYDVTVIAVHRKGEEELTVAPGANYVFQPGETAVVLGRYEDINRLNER